MNNDLDNYIIDDSNQLIDIITGEVIDKEEIKKAYIKKIINQRDEYADELNKMGINLDIAIMKYHGVEYPVVTIKKDFAFGKVFRLSVREAMKELSKNAKIFIATFEPYIYFPYNTVVTDNKNPTIEDMCKMLDLKKSTVYDIMKELEIKDVIKKIKLNGDLIIYFNPFLYCSGGVIHKDTYELFKDSVYNPHNNKEVIR